LGAKGGGPIKAPNTSAGVRGTIPDKTPGGLIWKEKGCGINDEIYMLKFNITREIRGKPVEQENKILRHTGKDVEREKGSTRGQREPHVAEKGGRVVLRRCLRGGALT